MKAILFALMILSPSMVLAEDAANTNCIKEVVDVNHDAIIDLSVNVIEINQQIVDQELETPKTEVEQIEILDTQIAIEDQKILTEEVAKKDVIKEEKAEVTQSRMDKFRAFLSNMADKTSHYAKIATEKTKAFSKVAFEKTKVFSKAAFEKSKELFNKGKEVATEIAKEQKAKLDEYNENNRINKEEAKKQLVNFTPAEPYFEHDSKFYNSFINVEQNKLSKVMANEAASLKYDSYYKIEGGEIYEVGANLSAKKLTSLKLELLAQKEILNAQVLSKTLNNQAQRTEFNKEINSAKALIAQAKLKLDKNKYDPQALIELNRATKVMSNIGDSIYLQMKQNQEQKTKPQEPKTKDQTVKIPEIKDNSQSQNGPTLKVDDVEIIDVEL